MIFTWISDAVRIGCIRVHHNRGETDQENFVIPFSRMPVDHLRLRYGTEARVVERRLSFADGQDKRHGLYTPRADSQVL